MKRRKINRLLLTKSMIHLGGIMPYLKMMAYGFFLSMPVISIQAQIVPSPTTYFDLANDERYYDPFIGHRFNATIWSNRFADFLRADFLIVDFPSNSTTVRYNANSTDCLKLNDQVPEWQFGTNQTSYFYGMSVNEAKKNLPTSYTMAGWFYFDFNFNFNDESAHANICGLYETGPIVKSYSNYTDELYSIWTRKIDQNLALNPDERFFAFNPTSAIALKNGKWHFVAITQSKYTTRMYVGIKDLNTFSCMSLPLGWQDPNGKWLIGDPSNKGLKAADDIMLWDYALNSDQLKALYECSKDKNPMSGNCWQSANANTSTARSAAPVAAKLQVSQSDPEPTAEPEKIDVYPNPTEGPLQVDINLREPSSVEINVHDLKGSLIYNTTTSLAAGKTHLQMNLQNETKCNCPGLSTQMVIVTIRTSKMLTAQKIIIQP